MATYNIGRIGFNLKDAYNSATSYNKLDVVSYMGACYVAKSACQGVAPTNSAYWMKLMDGNESENKFAVNDSLVIPVYKPFASGYVTNNGRDLRFTAFLGNALTNVNTVTISGPIVVRGVNGYATQASTDYPLDSQSSDYNITATIANRKAGMIFFMITRTAGTAFDNLTTNTPISVASGSSPLTLTFH